MNSRLSVSVDPLRQGRLHAALRDTRGATAAEFALVLPIFVALMFGLWEFGWSQHAASSVRLALNQTGRELMLNPALDAPTLERKVQARLNVVADPTVTVSMTQWANPEGVTLAKLTAQYPHTFTVPGMGAFSFNYQSTVVVPLP